jgi:hypothetical protein
MITPITKQVVEFVEYSFVDDNDIVQSDGDNPCNTARKLQLAVDAWEGGLKVTGGALGPDKSYWYLISFNWSGGRWYYAPVTDTPAVLYMNDINERQQVVRRISPHQAEETLGIWLAPSGDTKTQCKKMVEKSEIWANNMKTGRISKVETWIALQSTIWRTLSYPLNALNLSKKQCERIMSPALNYALPSMGIWRSFPRDLVFSSTKYAGIGVKHIHTLQEIARLKDILHHTYINSTTGKLYKSSLEFLLLELGISTDIASVNYEKYKSLTTHALVKNTWEFLNTHKITLNHNITIPKNTTMDILIMPEICKKHPSKADLEAINQCRLFLKAYYISDITTASGKNFRRTLGQVHKEQKVRPPCATGQIKDNQANHHGTPDANT